jgi:hypothetical protein
MNGPCGPTICGGIRNIGKQIEARPREVNEQARFNCPK